MDVSDLNPIWWDLAGSDRTILCFHMEYRVEQVGSNLRMPNPIISHTLLLHIMYINLFHNTGVSLMSGLTTFYFTPLLDQDETTACTATRSCDALIDGATNPLMREMKEFFREKGGPPIEYWKDAEITCACYPAFFVTIRGDTYPSSTLIISLIWFFDRN